MKMRTLICFSRIAGASLFGLLALSGICVAESKPPNIVWIFTEDMNDWMGCYGDHTVPTPNIDRLAENGTRFDRAYMPAGVCSATRSAIALGATGPVAAKSITGLLPVAKLRSAAKEVTASVKSGAPTKAPPPAVVVRAV